MELADQPIEAERLWQYQRLCGFRVSDRLPPTYLHLLAFPLGMALMTEPRFPFPLLGLVHVDNSITQHRPVHADERVTVRAWPAEPATASGRPGGRPGQRGVGRRRAGVAGDQQLPAPRSRPARTGSNDRRNRDRTTPDGPVIRWRAPSDIGRRYAAVSGDRNPIHLHPLTAKAFGFRSAIAHGMWLQARTLAAFAGRLPDRLECRWRSRPRCSCPARSSCGPSRPATSGGSR